MAHTALGASAAAPAACIAAFPLRLTAQIGPQRMPPGRPRRNVVRMARYAAKRRLLALTPSPAQKTQPTPYQQACAQVAELEGVLACLGRVWDSASNDLAHAKARMHQLRAAEYANGTGRVRGGAL